MEFSTNKLYHVDGMDSRQHLEQYLSDKPDMVFAEDLFIFPIENLKKTFTEGHINGDILVDISIGSMVHHLYSACEFFKDIIVIKTRDRCILELKRWVDTRTGAFDWGHAAKLHVDIEENSDQLQAKEEKMRSALQHLVKCNLEKENITDPIVLPPADCIISAWLLDVVCKEQDDFIRYLRRFSRLLKPGGHIILIGSFGATYFSVSNEKFQALTYEEELVRKALAGEGFVIDKFVVKERTAQLYKDLENHSGVILSVAKDYTMESSTNKLYHVDGMDSRQHLEHYLSDKPDMVFGEDFFIFPIENLKKTFTEGHIKGDILIDLSIGSMVHHLYSACEFFKDIIVIKTRDRCILELKRWVDTRTGAFDWGHAAKLHVDIEENSDQLQAKEEKMRSALQHVVKCNLEKENITDPIVLPPADCIISAWLLDVVCKEQDDFIRYLRRFSRLLKPGGHLILLGSFGATYFSVSNEKFQALTYDEAFVRKALAGEGFVIDKFVVKERTAVSDFTDYKFITFIVAHKEK